MTRPHVDFSQTIFALSSGKLPSAVAIEKLSGPRAFEIAQKLFLDENGSPLSRARGFFYGQLLDCSGRRLDSCLALTFVAPHSHTGEDIVEFQVHGSLAIVRALEHAFLELGAVPAKPGEFSYRALMNGRTTPDDVERLGDLFLSQSPSDVTAIWERDDRSLAQEIAKLREELIRVQAILDTAVDFSDEYSDVLHAAEYPIERVLASAQMAIRRFDVFSGAERKPSTTLYGKPNAGKSSLFNALLGRERALVSASPGTTRDVVSEDFSVAGSQWTLQDTAGIRSSAGEIEQAGIVLAHASLKNANIRVLVVDGTEGLSHEELETFENPAARPQLIAWNKTDLANAKSPAEIGIPCLSVSAFTGAGVVELKRYLDVLVERDPASHAPLITSVQRARLGTAEQSLGLVREAILRRELPELIAEKNRKAISDLEVVIGEISTDDVLDRVFGEFCIGK